MNFQVQSLGTNWVVCTDKQHCFNTDSFLLADFAAPHYRDKVCDFGSGCGILPVLLDKFYRPAYILAVELQETAAMLARKSLSQSALHAEVEVLNIDFRKLSGEYTGKFDVVVCNPPYQALGRGKVSKNEEAEIARHEVCCTIEQVCQSASKLLRARGKLCVCQRAERLADTICAMRNAALEPKRMRFCAKDEKTRPWMVLLEAKKEGHPFLNVMPTLTVYNHQGGASEEMQRIYQQEATF